jgi:hypothetical protein
MTQAGMNMVLISELPYTQRSMTLPMYIDLKLYIIIPGPLFHLYPSFSGPLFSHVSRYGLGCRSSYQL